MPIAPFIIAFGDSPEVELQASATVDIAPADNSVDTNRVRIVGTGTISSFGVACGALTRWQNDPDPDDEAATDDVITVTKRVTFIPTAPGSITLHHNPPGLSLLGGVDRVISKPSFGEYQSDIYGWWTETNYSPSELQPTKSGGQMLGLNYYSASATITIPAGATRAHVKMWGGSAGAHGYDVYTSVTLNTATGAAGYLEKFLTGLTPGRTLTFTFGAKGHGGNAAYNSSNAVTLGTAGGNSILASGTQTIATLTASGSPIASTSNPMAGGLGGTATGGDINVAGQAGTDGWSTYDSVMGNTYNVTTSNPGATFYSKGAARGTVNNPAYPGPGQPYQFANSGTDGGLIIAWYNDAFL